MRRQRRQILKDRDNFKSILYLSGSVLGIAILTFIITFAIYGNRIKESEISALDTQKIAELIPNNVIEEDMEQASLSIGKTVEESKVNANILNETVSNEIVETANNEESKVEVENKDENEEKVEEQIEEEKEPEFKYPVEGEIIKEYAKENLVYSKTLDEWITHNGIDIKADKTAVVKAAETGKITAIKNDPRYGLTVVIEHTRGYKTVYSNLLTAEFVSIGEKVKLGQTIATVGNSANFESADEPHLHFEILKDNMNLDPNIYLK